MSFSSPAWLALLALIPLAIAAYAYSERRARRFAIRFPAASTLLAAGAQVSTWRRHVPAALALLAVASLALAMAKPHHTVRVAIQKASIVLVTDHSGSMQATDVDPTRLAAAQRAARTFIDKLPGAVRVGAVAFSQAPDEVEAPTTDHDVAKRVINAQVAFGATATGDALQAALDVIGTQAGHPPAAIVLLSDGATTAGRDPVGVARIAAKAKIPIYTVALGTEGATVPNPNPFGPPLSAAPDPQTLHEIARVTHATSFTAQDENKLNEIYQRLGSQLGSRSKSKEITATFVILALLLAIAAGATSVRTAGRLP